MKSKTTTIGEKILEMPRRSQSKAAIKIKEKRRWRDISWSEYYSSIVQAASAFVNAGFKKGDTVAIMSNTRWEWAMCDLAIMGLQGVVVPIYQNSTAEEVEFILNHSEAKFFICENKYSLLIWRKIREQCPHVKSVICFEVDKPEDDTVEMWPRFFARGTDNLKENQETFEAHCRKIKPEDRATIIYTSGTTGRPKGVVICHEQITSEVTEAFPLCGVTAADTTLTFLPFAHVLGRIEHWGQVFLGYTNAYAESIEKIRYNLPEIKPTILVAVPRIFEKVYSHILAQIETQTLKKRIFSWAIEVGKKVSYHKITRQRISIPLLLEYEAARRLVLNKVSDAFGGQLRFAISGGAPISPDLAQFFHAAGILILEGYGLTETTAAIAVNTPYNYKFGSVGRPIGDTQVKLASDGELLIKSKKVMKEYFKDPESTKKALVDGWFHTGDIAEILPGGDIKITDRKKDLIKTAGGKYVAPQKIESLLRNNPLISHVLIHGDQKKYIVCLITLDRIYLENWAKEQNWDYSKWTDLVEHPEVVQNVRQTIDEANAKLGSFESIKKFKILPTEFTVENGELTPSLKVKRKFLDEKFKDEIESLYS